MMFLESESALSIIHLVALYLSHSLLTWTRRLPFVIDGDGGIGHVNEASTTVAAFSGGDWTPLEEFNRAPCALSKARSIGPDIVAAK